MNKKVQIVLPDYLRVKDYQKLQNLEHLSDLEKTITSISIMGNIDVDDIRKWSIEDVSTIYNDMSKALNIEEVFFPVFELDGVMYGYSHLNKMSLGEYYDLETLCKSPVENLHEIMSIIYRPIVSHRFNDISWNLKHRYRIAKKDVKDIFKEYKLEPYDSEKRDDNIEMMKELPIGFAMGALGFFLLTATRYLNDIQPSSNKKEIMRKQILQEKNLSLFSNIGVGLRQFIHYPNQIYSLSVETRV